MLKRNGSDAARIRPVLLCQEHYFANQSFRPFLDKNTRSDKKS
nr:hypothetical protein [uncultured Dyadobacter sp.]